MTANPKTIMCVCAHVGGDGGLQLIKPLNSLLHLKSEAILLSLTSAGRVPKKERKHFYKQSFELPFYQHFVDSTLLQLKVTSKFATKFIE